MKNKKIELQKLKVQSFVTQVDGEKEQTIVGGLQSDTLLLFVCLGIPNTKSICTRDFHACNQPPSEVPYCPPATNPACTYPTSPTCDLDTDVCPY